MRPERVVTLCLCATN